MNENNQLPPSSWSSLQNQPQVAPQNAPMDGGQPQQQQMTPDQTYPSFPNAAHLGTGVPYPIPPEVLPVPAFHEQQQMPQGPVDPSLNPWSAMRGVGGQ